MAPYGGGSKIVKFMKQQAQINSVADNTQGLITTKQRAGEFSFATNLLNWFFFQI